MHPRQAIREAIRSALGGIPALAGRVETNRARPTGEAELPRAIVYTLQETSEQIEVGGGLQRELSVGIEVRTRASVDLDDALDDLSAEVEAAMADDLTLGGLADNLTLTRTQIGLDGEGEAPQALVTLVYAVTYFTGA